MLPKHYFKLHNKQAEKVIPNKRSADTSLNIKTWFNNRRR